MIGKQKKQHRGLLLAIAVQNSRYTRTDAAKRARYCRSTYYKHIRQADLSYDILERYGKAIYHNFAEDLPEMRRYSIEDPSESFNEETRNPRELVRQRDYWKKRYYEQLERNNKLLERLAGENRGDHVEREA
ncbi:MAG: hypothetical protein NVV59_11835 [Chitinophagaceae bacterium]|nr:hypothetical protein [Chitinophagaceae bacterium]